MHDIRYGFYKFVIIYWELNIMKNIINENLIKKLGKPNYMWMVGVSHVSYR